jgi:hypothetical protein
MRYFIVLAVILFGIISQAQVQVPLVLLEGRDLRNGRICQLRITAMQGTHPVESHFALEVETSYSHDRDQAPALIVNKWEGQTLRGEDGPNKISITFSGRKEDFQFKNITGFALSWFHINHSHNYRCADLTLK